MYCICWEHDTVTTWGCRECLRESLSKIVDRSIEDLNRELSRIAERHRQGANARPKAS